MSRDFVLVVRGERAETFRRLLGSERVCVTSPIPALVELPGRGPTLVHFLDLDELRPDQMERVVGYTAGRFGLSEDEAREGIRREGMPIVAEDATVVVHSPQRWLT